MAYLVIYIFEWILLIAIPLGIVGVFLKIIISSRIRPEVKSLISLCILVVPLVFGFNLWKKYTDTCNSIGSITKYQSVPRQSFLGVEYNVEFKERYFDIQFKHIKENLGNFCVEEIREGRYLNQCSKKLEWKNNQQATVKLLIETEKVFYGFGWILKYKIIDLSSNSLIGEAKEALLGRGILGKYIGLLNKSLNNEYYACGYINRSPDIWRSSRNFEAYIAQDSKLISTAIGANDNFP